MDIRRPYCLQIHLRTHIGLRLSRFSRANFEIAGLTSIAEVSRLLRGRWCYVPDHLSQHHEAESSGAEKFQTEQGG
jgi:hypothetical protein